MNQSLLQKLAPMGVAAIGAIAATGIASAPAQAGQLGWDDATSDFYSDVINPDGTLTGNDFSVTFSPDALAAVFSATEQFAPFFNPPELAFVDPITVGFDNFVDLGVVAGIQEFEYDLANDLVFDFGNGVIVTLAADSTFLGEIDAAGGTLEGVELEVVDIAGVTVQIGSDTYTLGGPKLFVTGFAFEFEDIAAIGGGEYAGLVSVAAKVPEPGTILGLLAFGGLGLGLKRKKEQG